MPHETFWHMVKHFLYDITHFDSKFFDSMKYLLFKPGFLPQEYIKGRRASYLNPVKKYVFTSAVFFLLFFSFFISTNSIEKGLNGPLSVEDRIERVKEAEKELILRALKETKGNRTRAAKKIGMARRTFHRKLHTYHLEGF